MKLRITHTTRYAYDHPVGFAPHALYLRPRETSRRRLLRYDLSVPAATKLVTERDAHDNDLVRAFFWGDPARSLDIHVEAEVHNLDLNPFDFLVDPDAHAFPFAYAPAVAAALAPYLAPPAPATAAALRAWLDREFADRPAETVPFHAALNALLHQRIAYARRDEPGIQTSPQTLDRGTGSCRDVAVLLADILRLHGVAARFVSGYLYVPAEETDNRADNAMHAWVEAYLPGAGWRGLDPTHGIWCDACYVPCAHAAAPELVAPVQGVIASDQAATATMTARLEITEI